jgi:hypothetical protein
LNGRQNLRVIVDEQNSRHDSTLCRARFILWA